MKLKKFYPGIGLVFLLTGCNLIHFPSFPFSKTSSSDSQQEPQVSSESLTSQGTTTSSGTNTSSGKTTSSATTTSSGKTSSSATTTSSGKTSSSSTTTSSGKTSSSGGTTTSSSTTSSGGGSDVDKYYSGISDSLSGASLKTELFKLIKITTAGWSYDGLWTAYKTTDCRPDGSVWDIYSDKTTYQFGNKQCGSYKKEGDCWNREHMIPQGSFNEAAPMKSDAHHVLPSDGYVNNRRGSYPHGDVKSATYTSQDGCKLGSSNVTGYSGTVFEPISHYKGDTARIYFYFVTCYQDKMSSNTFDGFDKTTFPSIKTSLLECYLKWAIDDPVSEKEVVRNNAVFAGQGNRNPFIDRPDYACKIWGNVNDNTKKICGIN